MAPSESSLAGGRLLGTAKVQEGVDDVGKALKELASEIKKLAGLSRATYAPGSNMSAAVPLSYGRDNGGQATFSGLSASQSRGAVTLPQATAGTQAAPTTPNGGGATFGQRTAATAGVLASSAVAYGNAQQADQVGADYVTQYVRGANNGMSYSSTAKSLFTNRFFGQSTADVQQSAASFFSMSGRAATPGGFNQYGAIGGVSMVNPGMSAAATTQAYMAASSGAGYWGLKRFGVNTVTANGKAANALSINQQITSKVMGIGANHQWTDGQIRQSFDNQNSNINNNLRMLVQQGTITQDMADAYLQTERSYAQASQSGMTRQAFNSLMNKAGNGDSSARQQLIDAGVKNLDTSLSQMQAQAGTQRNRQTNQQESFNAALQKSSEVVQQFSQAITDFLAKTGLDKAIGGTSGAASIFGGAMSGPMGFLGGLGGAMFGPGMLSKLGGGIPGMGGAGGMLGRAGTALRGGAAALGGGITATGAATVALGAGAVASVGAAVGRTRGTLENNKTWTAFSDMYDKNFDSYTPAQQKYLMSRYGEVQDAIARDDHINNTDSVLHSMFYGNQTSELDTVMQSIASGMPGAGGGGESEGRSSGSRPQSSGKPMVSGDAVVRYAMTFVNKVPYVFGGTTPSGWDCSGFVMYVFNHFGVHLPRLAGDQARSGSPVSKGNMKPGDLVFFENNGSNGARADHVGIYIGGGKMVNAPHTGAMTRVEAIWSSFTHARRVVGAGSGSFGGGNGRQDRNADTATGNGSGASGALGAGSEAAVVSAALSGIAGGSAGASSSARRASGGAGGSSSWGGAGSMSGQALLSTLKKAGFSGAALQTAWAVAHAESGARPNAHVQDSDDNSYGLFQINMLGDLGPARRAQYGLSSNNELFDPLTNAKIAFAMSGGGKNWGPWSAYTNGSYKQFLDDVPGYDKGAWKIGQDQLAMVHKGEMVLKADQAETIRNALLTSNLGHGNSQRHVGGGVQIIFGERSLVFQGGAGGGSERAARDFGKAVVDTITRDQRIKALQDGN